jgi:hypothetical protein
MKAEAKTAIAELVHKCDKISKGCSQQLLSAVIEKTPLRNVETKNIEAQKLDNMMTYASPTTKRISVLLIRLGC